eukprot:3185445-Lingulodinium_polyedra.AAC.1
MHDVLDVLAAGAGGQERVVVVVLAAYPAPEPFVFAVRDQEVAPCWPSVGWYVVGRAGAPGVLCLVGGRQ